MIGGLCICLGLLGILVPLLPTTPFLLLASGCFMRSSPRFHRWLHQHPTFGPILTNWHQHRALNAKVKRNARWMIVISFTFSILIVPFIWLKVTLFLFLIILLWWFNRIPVIEHLADQQENH
ncbi:YbaN family protein [Vibrio sp.]|uniref:YbaN family protein n=1 Tax=Vibrio sp. TaxID=678 RepID=UPI003D105B19